MTILKNLVNCTFNQLRFFSKQESKSLLQSSIPKFVDYLIANDMKRCFFISKRTPDLVMSHDKLDDLKPLFTSSNPDFQQHEGVLLQVGSRTKCLLGTFLWRTDRGQACGGVRLHKYRNVQDFLNDGLRLSKAMGVKSALAGLWYGGGQGVMAAPENHEHLNPEFREKLLYDYGDFLTSLNGCFIGGEDIGITVNDLNVVRERSRYVVGISEDKGGSGNPAYSTGRGVVCAMEAAVDYLDLGDLKGKHILVQGAGNAGIAVINALLRHGVDHITAVECNQKRMEDLTHGFSDILQDSNRLKLIKVPLDDTSALSFDCDIFSPCACGNVLNTETIPHIRARIVCGAANNQLANPEHNQLMVDAGITYVVDFVANRMGLVRCCNEIFGRLPNDPQIERHFSKDYEDGIYRRVQTILSQSEDDVTPVLAAYQLADKLSRCENPLWPGRTQLILESLVREGWHLNRDYWRRRDNYLHSSPY